MGCIAQRKEIKISRNLSNRAVKMEKLNDDKHQQSTICRPSMKDIIDSSLCYSVKIKNLIPKIDSKFETHYKLISKIGRGSFGSVYKVLQIKSGLIRAMKVIKQEYLKYQDDDKTFLKEIEILMKLEHPNIIKIFEYYIDEVNYYLITEYISGGELYDGLIKLHNFNEYRAEFIMHQIISAINYLHSNRIVHRDIKPENILIDYGINNDSDTSNGLLNIKLIDFGSCNYISNDKKLTMKVGSPHYIAPEVLRKSYDMKCDIWSSGIILHILLVGYPPFKASNKVDLFNRIKKGKFSMKGPQWEKVSKEAKDLLLHMLEYDPKMRYSAEQCLDHPWIKLKEKAKIDEIQDDYYKSVLEKICNFNAKEKLQQATIAYIVHSLYADNELEDLKKVFAKLDENGDGKLTYQEMKNGFMQCFEKNDFFTDDKIDQIIHQMDGNNDGIISYEEFLRAVVNQRMLLHEDNLRKAFERFDLNNDGLLSKEELKSVLDTTDLNYIEQLLSVIDENKDGFVSYKEFQALMSSIFVKSKCY